MKKITFLATIFLASMIAFSPYVTSAQSYSGEWRVRSSSLRRSINKLDDDRVKNVPMPILFGLTPDNITPNFGDPRSGGRKHEGLDIMAPLGAPVVSPTEAVVIRTGEGDSAGNYVYTANPGGETFAYMHLDEIADIDEGDILKKGDLIGYVGNTGNASGGATHLHFEIQDDHDATDPYLRIKSIFPLADKIKYLETILDDVKSEKEFAYNMVKLYRSEFVLAQKLNIILLDSIMDALSSVPSSVSTNISSTLKGDLTLGSKGALVTELQKFLINKNIGSASKMVADGSFGPITQKALAEYQASVGIKPAVGYYGPITRAYILAYSE
ncbi:MAG TPA: peptidoglycan DD-metalloendopeptidase family protein [Candidatus Paceibacterota bacterium]